MLRLGVAVAIALLNVACADFNECSSQINQRFLPGDTTIVVGQQFTAQILVTTCDGRQILNSSPTWHSQDTVVASVAAVTGRVTGRATGETVITASGGFYTITGSIHVTVR